MPQTIKCRDGSVYVDERLTVEEWVEKTYGAGVRVEGVAISEDSLIATISYPESIFPYENVRINFVDVPDDVLFKMNQGSRRKFVKKYFANREEFGNRVFIEQSDGENTTKVEFSPELSLKIRNHSPSGFEWAYSGSGPAQLALAILFDVTDDRVVAERQYQDFKSRVIANLNAGEWTLHEEDVRQWLKNAEEGVLL